MRYRFMPPFQASAGCSPALSQAIRFPDESRAKKSTESRNCNIAMPTAGTETRGALALTMAAIGRAKTGAGAADPRHEPLVPQGNRDYQSVRAFRAFQPVPDDLSEQAIPIMTAISGDTRPNCLDRI